MGFEHGRSEWEVKVEGSEVKRDLERFEDG
jgi:hypothetical protein